MRQNSMRYLRALGNTACGVACSYAQITLQDNDHLYIENTDTTGGRLRC